MSFAAKIPFRAPQLSRPRVWFALSVAITIDLLQIFLGPFGWLWVDQGLDLFAMILISGAVGFHVLLLPTFALELIPVVGMVPTWTGCTLLVISFRRRTQTTGTRAAETPPAPEPPPIDISAEVTRVPPKL
jgi:hypothetical protein